MTLQYARLVKPPNRLKWAGGKRQLVRALSENILKNMYHILNKFHILEQNPSQRCHCICTPSRSFSIYAVR